MGTRFFFVGSKAVHQVTKQSAGRIAVGELISRGLQLDKGVACGHPILELRLHRVEIFVPHKLDVADWSRVVEHEEEVLEEFEVFLEFALQSTAQDTLWLFQLNPPLAANRTIKMTLQTMPV